MKHVKIFTFFGISILATTSTAALEQAIGSTNNKGEFYAREIELDQQKHQLEKLSRQVDTLGVRLTASEQENARLKQRAQNLEGRLNSNENVQTNTKTTLTYNPSRATFSLTSKEFRNTDYRHVRFTRNAQITSATSHSFYSEIETK